MDEKFEPTASAQEPESEPESSSLGVSAEEKEAEPVVDAPPTETTPLELPCVACHSLISTKASICRCCGAHQHRILRPLDRIARLAGIGVLILTILQLLLGYQQVVLATRQLDSAQQSSVEISKALQEARENAGRIESIADQMAATQAALLAAQERAEAASMAISSVNAEVSEARVAATNAGKQARRLEAQAQLNSHMIRAQAGSYESFREVYGYAKRKDELGRTARIAVKSIAQGFRSRRPSGGAQILSIPTYQDAAGHPVPNTLVSADQLFAELRNPELPEMTRLGLVSILRDRPGEQLVGPATKVLRDSSTPLVAIADTCTILEARFGKKAEFLDYAGWLGFLTKQPFVRAPLVYR